MTPLNFLQFPAGHCNMEHYAKAVSLNICFTNQMLHDRASCYSVLELT